MNTINIKEIKEAFNNGSHCSGAYGFVAFVENKTKAVKIFKKNHTREQAKKVFESEVQAYELIQENEKLRSITPTFFGKVTIDKEESEEDDLSLDLSLNLYFEFAYLMSCEVGTFIKLENIDDRDEYEKIITLFNEHGIKHVKDSSVILNDDKVKMVIDFAMKEFPL
ncbi:hypothetical protein QDQ39_03805 [Providencia rettgeri]|uniref:hypothetical protein n=1 Tax=Providencia TaxID=586 RepID=UPI00244825B8|nr:hypothetical protein [Providencia rettgeri]MDH2394923.1 hypothetical protein [Providencia rettgeri]